MEFWKGIITTIRRYEKHQPDTRYTDSGSTNTQKGYIDAEWGYQSRSTPNIQPVMSKWTTQIKKDYGIGDLAAIYCGQSSREKRSGEIALK